MKFRATWRGAAYYRGGGGGLFKILWQRQNYTMSMEFETPRSFDNNYELLHYTTNTIKNWKTEIKSIFNTVCLLF